MTDTNKTTVITESYSMYLLTREILVSIDAPVFVDTGRSAACRVTGHKHFTTWPKLNRSQVWLECCRVKGTLCLQKDSLTFSETSDTI